MMTRKKGSRKSLDRKVGTQTLNTPLKSQGTNTHTGRTSTRKTSADPIMRLSPFHMITLKQIAAMSPEQKMDRLQTLIDLRIKPWRDTAVELLWRYKARGVIIQNLLERLMIYESRIFADPTLTSNILRSFLTGKKVPTTSETGQRPTYPQNYNFEGEIANRATGQDLHTKFKTTTLPPKLT
jgi:hypothetical protein